MNSQLQEILRNPVKSRLVFDFLAAVGVVGFVSVVLHFANFQPFFGPALLFPILLVGFNAMLGIYGWFKTAGVPVKALALGLANLCNLGLYALAGAPVSVMLLIAGFSFVLTFLPRFFFNFYTSRTWPTAMSALQSHKLPILVVGGAGYIGSAVVGKLLQRNHKVRVLDTFLFGSESLNAFRGDHNLEIIEGDVADLYTMTQALTGVSAVVHLAGIVGDPACAVDESMTRHLNTSTTHMLKEAAKAFGIPRFIFASSCSVYGLTEKVVDERSGLNPVSLYAKTKIDSEQELLNDPSDNFHPTILRFATVFGHSRRPRFDLVANLFAAQAYNEGIITVTGKGQWRPFVHVNDLAGAIVAVLEAPLAEVSRQIFNVGDDSINITIDGLAELVQSIIPKNKKGKLVKVVINEGVGDRRNYRVSFEKIRQTLGFRCQTPLADGVAEIRDHFERETYQLPYTHDRYSNVATIKKYLTQFYSEAYRKTHIMPMSDR